MISREACNGCHDDFYNAAGNSSDGRCWSAKTGKMITRYAIHFMTAPTQKGAFEKVRKPSCYHQVNQCGFYNELPSFVKASDLRREKRSIAQSASAKRSYGRLSFVTR